MLAWLKFTPPVIDLERKSAGNFSRMGSSGISRSDMLGGAVLTGAGAKLCCGGGAAVATGAAG